MSGTDLAYGATQLRRRGRKPGQGTPYACAANSKTKRCVPRTLCTEFSAFVFDVACVWSGMGMMLCQMGDAWSCGVEGIVLVSLRYYCTKLGILLYRVWDPVVPSWGYYSTETGILWYQSEEGYNVPAFLVQQSSDAPQVSQLRVSPQNIRACSCIPTRVSYSHTRVLLHINAYLARSHRLLALTCRFPTRISH
eukprot:1227547-Rhodomonas_salina.1